MGFGARVKDPDDAAEAERAAVRLLARRGFSRAELRERLLARGVSTAVIEALLDKSCERGWIDERRSAVAHALAGIAKGRGRSRIVRELRARGLGELAASAWEQALAEHGCDAEALLRAEVVRRVQRGGERLAPEQYSRLYNALLRAGHDAEAVRAQLEPHRESPDGAWEV